MSSQAVASYRIVGTKGHLHVNPAYEYAEGLAYELPTNGKTTRRRIVQALYESADTGKVVQIPPFRSRQRPSGRQRITRPGIRKPDLVKVRSAGED